VWFHCLAEICKALPEKHEFEHVSLKPEYLWSTQRDSQNPSVMLNAANDEIFNVFEIIF